MIGAAGGCDFGPVGFISGVVGFSDALPRPDPIDALEYVCVALLLYVLASAVILLILVCNWMRRVQAFTSGCGMGIGASLVMVALLAYAQHDNIVEFRSLYVLSALCLGLPQGLVYVLASYINVGCEDSQNSEERSESAD